MTDAGNAFGSVSRLRRNRMFLLCVLFVLALIALDVWTVGSFFHSFFGGEIEEDIISTLVLQDWLICIANILLIALYVLLLAIMTFRLLRGAVSGHFRPEAFFLLWHSAICLFCAVAELGHCFSWKSFFVTATDGMRTVAMLPLLLCFCVWLKRSKWLLFPVLAEGTLASVCLIMRTTGGPEDVLYILRFADDVLFLFCVASAAAFGLAESGKREKNLSFHRFPAILGFVSGTAFLLFGLLLLFSRSFEDAWELLMIPGETVIHSVRMHIVNNVLLISVLLLLVQQFLNEYFTRIIEENALETKLAANEEYTESLHQYEQSVRELKHDMSNRLHAAALMCEDGKYEELRAYLKSMTDEVDATKRRTFCANTLANYLLQTFDRRFAEHGVQFKCEAMLPHDLNVPDKDLASIFSNLLQNALEASGDAPEGNRFAEFRAVFDENGVVRIRCRNSYGREPVKGDDGRIRTIKKDSVSHGLGLGIIRKTAEKAGGAVSVNYGSGIFEVRVALPTANGQ